MRFGTPTAPFTPMFAAGVNARAKHNRQLKSSLNRRRLALFIYLFIFFKQIWSSTAAAPATDWIAAL